jgi:hypothetical protein
MLKNTYQASNFSTIKVRSTGFDHEMMTIPDKSDHEKVSE